MKVLDSHEAKEIDSLVEESIDEKTLVFSVKSSSYVNISDYVEVHVQEKSNAETTKTTLQLVHIAIANTKRWILGIHHMVKGKYLPSKILQARLRISILYLILIVQMKLFICCLCNFVLLNLYYYLSNS